MPWRPDDDTESDAVEKSCVTLNNCAKLVIIECGGGGEGRGGRSPSGRRTVLYRTEIGTNLYVVAVIPIV